MTAGTDHNLEGTQMTNLRYAPDGYAFFSVIGTNCWNVEHMLPIDQDEWTDDDYKRMDELDRVADAIGTSVRKSHYALLT